MSFNRDNVVWQSQNGTWSIGFWDFYNVNTDSDDFDHEWDVEYTQDFNWVSTGHPTEEAAINSWDGANPGGHEIMEYRPENAAIIKQYDEKAAAFRAQKANAGTRTPRFY